MVAAAKHFRHPACEIALGVDAASTGSRVDREQCVIRGVKIAGFQSKNRGRTIGLSEAEFGPAANEPYSYAREAFVRALPMYEGAKVYTNHPRFKVDSKTGQRIPVVEERNDEELIGWLQNVRVGDDGVYGDLHYLKSHRLSETLCEVAERNPALMALSHEAYFDNPRVVNGRAVLMDITRVDAVALVAGEPGTTDTLFETAAGTDPMVKRTKKLRSIFEGWNHLESPLRKRVLEMMGDGMPQAPMAAQEVEVPGTDAEPAKPEDEVKEAFKALINSVIDSAKTPDEAKEKIMALLDAQQAAADALKGGKPDAPPAAESLAPVVPATNTAAAATNAALLESAQLLAEAGRPAPKVVLEAMAALADTAARRAFIAATAVSAAPTLPTTPRSGAPVPTPAPAPAAVLETKVPADEAGKYTKPGEFAAALRGGRV